MVVDCACTNFPAGLGNVTIGANLLVGLSIAAGYRLDVNGNARITGASQIPLVLRGGAPGLTHSSVIQFEAPNTQPTWQLGGGGPFGIEQAFTLADVSAGVPQFRLYVGPTGNVSVGTISPQAKFHVAGGQTRLTANSQIPLVLDPPGAGGAPHTSVIQFNDVAGNARWQLGAGVTGGAAEFGLLDNGPGGGLRLYVNAGGNVGIGIAQPTQKLSVQGGIRLGDSPFEAGVPSALMIRRAGADSANYITMINEGTVTGSISSGGAGRRQDLVFSNDAAGNYIFNTGSVGVGTTAPQDRLHVNGSIRADGAIHTENSQDISASGDVRAGRNVIANGHTIADSAGKVYGAVYG